MTAFKYLERNGKILLLPCSATPGIFVIRLASKDIEKDPLPPEWAAFWRIIEEINILKARSDKPFRHKRTEKAIKC